MVTRFALLPMVAVLATCACCSVAWAEEQKPKAAQMTISLPSVEFNSKMTVEQAIQQRRSVRAYSDQPVTLHQVSMLLWAAQGITDPAHGLRTAPSAHATYPLTVYLVAGTVQDLPAGVYKYIPAGHKLELVASGDRRGKVGAQPQMRNAPVLLAYAADYTFAGKKFGDRAHSFADIEVGHSAQNVLLEEVALGLVGVGMAGYDELNIRSALGLPANEQPVYVVSAGNPQVKK